MSPRTFLWPLVLATSGCTSYSVAKVATPIVAPHAAVPADRAEICVIRPNAAGFLAPSDVRDNGRLVGGLRSNTYFCYWAAPGHHRIVAFAGDDIDRRLGTGDQQEAEIDAAAGQRYYLHHGVPHVLGLMLNWVDEASAAQLIADCAYVRLTSVPGAEALPDPNAVAPAARAK